MDVGFYLTAMPVDRVTYAGDLLGDKAAPRERFGDVTPSTPSGGRACWTSDPAGVSDIWERRSGAVRVAVGPRGIGRGPRNHPVQLAGLLEEMVLSLGGLT